MGGAGMGEIENLRKVINMIDEIVVELLERRMEVCRQIGEEKKRLDLPIDDPERERELLNRYWAGWEDVFHLIMERCKKLQRDPRPLV